MAVVLAGKGHSKRSNHQLRLFQLTDESLRHLVSRDVRGQTRIFEWHTAIPLSEIAFVFQ